MAKENIQSLQIDFGSHRKKYQKKIFDLIHNLKNTPNEKKAGKIDNCLVLKLYTLLRNFGIYRDDDFHDVIEYFKKDNILFYQRLENYLSSIENKRKIYKALSIIKNQILNIRDFSSNGFYEDLMDDLKAELGFNIPNIYNNFIEPSIYNNNEISILSISEETKNISDQYKPNYK